MRAGCSERASEGDARSRPMIRCVAGWTSPARTGCCEADQVRRFRAPARGIIDVWLVLVGLSVSAVAMTSAAGQGPGTGTAAGQKQGVSGPRAMNPHQGLVGCRPAEVARLAKIHRAGGASDEAKVVARLLRDADKALGHHAAAL